MAHRRHYIGGDVSLKEFIDEYKHLEKMCSEMYGQQHGISQYIADMEQTSSYTAGRIPGWNNDLANLKRVRYIRNKMVHDAEDYDDAYEPEDLEFLRQFYQRILNQQDPLATKARQAQKTTQEKQKTSKIPEIITPTYFVPSTYSIRPTSSGVIPNDDRKVKRNKVSLKNIVVPCVIILVIVLLSILYLYAN